ncbi:MAG: penicillin-binding protein activator [Deltaproteobacteria bacterium]|nr:penicillin-binding protein activator [Deltaproteobacteria bacterium]
MLLKNRDAFPIITCLAEILKSTLVVLLAIHILAGCGKQVISPDRELAVPGDRLFIKAEKDFKTGAYDAAMDRYRSYLAQYPQGARADAAIMKLAAIHLARAEYTEARAYYERLATDHPSSPYNADARVAVLSSYYHEGLYTHVFQGVQALLADSPPRIVQLRLYSLLGDAYLAQDSVMDAVDAYGQALKLSTGGEMAEIRTMLIGAASRLDAADIDQLLAGPDYLPKSHLLYQLALTHVAKNRDQEAVITLSRFIETYPNHEHGDEARSLYGIIRQKSLYDRQAIGCLLPLSGTFEAYGKRALRGIELAWSRFSEKNPLHQIRLIVKDTGSDSKMAIEALRELYEARVAAVIGPIVTAKKAAQAAQDYGIPIIALTGKDNIAEVGDFVFRNFLTAKAQVTTLVSYLCDEMGLRRFAILYPEERYGRTFMNLFWDEVLAHGGRVVGVEPYRTQATDFADPIRKLVGLYYEVPEELQEADTITFDLTDEDSVTRYMDVLNQDKIFESDLEEMFPFLLESDKNGVQLKEDREANATVIEDILEELSGEGDFTKEVDEEPKTVVDFDAVFIPDAPQKAGLIVPQLAFFDVENVYFVGTNLWHSAELIQMARKYVQHAMMTDGFFAESKLAHVKEFALAYEAVYSEPPGFIDAVSYDTAVILLDLVNRPDIVFRSTIKEMLKKMEPHSGVTGLTAFSEMGEVKKDLFLLKIKGKYFRSVATKSQFETSQ